MQITCTVMPSFGLVVPQSSKQEKFHVLWHVVLQEPKHRKNDFQDREHTRLCNLNPFH